MCRSLCRESGVGNECGWTGNNLECEVSRYAFKDLEMKEFCLDTKTIIKNISCCGTLL